MAIVGAIVAFTMWGLAALAMFFTALVGVGLFGSAIIARKLIDYFGDIRRLINRI